MNPIKPPTFDASKLGKLSAKPAELPIPSKNLELKESASALLHEVKDTFERAQSKLDDLSGASSEMMFQMQVMMARMTQAAAVTSNASKKHSDATNAILGNIKG